MPRICEPGGSGWFLPTDEEQDWPNWIRAFLYAIAMIYFFLGIAIISDKFMASIEAITSWKRRVHVRSGRRITVKIWNETVATLSLMALGSSAPEICLSVIELFKLDMLAGDLGSSTIVGSAAFNLFVIIAACIMAIPSTEVRRIKEFSAFLITVVFSVFAYLWLAFILVMVSSNVVNIPEALLTLGFLPVLISISYSADAGALKGLLERVPLLRNDEEEAEVRDGAGRVSFHSEHIFVKPSEMQTVEVKIVRRGGSKGAVSCQFHTERFSAVPRLDFVEACGTVEFGDGITQQIVELTLLPEESFRSREFFVIIDALSGGASFHPDDDGGEESAILTVSLEAARKPSSFHDSMLCRLDLLLNFHSIRYGNLEWIDQITNAIYCNGSPEEQANASLSDWILHVLSLPWTFVFALVPPPCYAGGTICFWLSLGSIGLLTAFVSDLAELFGCVLSFPEIGVAITFVALGTSMPDLFASLNAARADPTADASIVNVTGSNAVNVFLGLGLPWSIASVHWWYQGKEFVVESRNLGFSVLAFCGCCFLAIFLLVLRRRYIGGELGGPFAVKVATALSLIVNWAMWVTLTIWRVLRCVGAAPGHFCKASIMEQGAVIGGAVAVMMGACAVATVLVLRAHQQPHMAEEEQRRNADNAEEQHTDIQVGMDAASTASKGGATTEVSADSDGARPTMKKAFSLSIGEEKPPARCSVQGPQPMTQIRDKDEAAAQT